MKLAWMNVPPEHRDRMALAWVDEGRWLVDPT